MIVLKRAQIGFKAGVDITVKSATGLAMSFAPTWQMVTDIKARRITQAQYVQQYRQILDLAPDAAWSWLWQQAVGGELTLLCYCADANWDGSPKFCHTHVLIDYMLRRWPEFFIDGREDR